MKKNGVFLASCSFLFQAPMPAHVAESTAEHTHTHTHTKRAQKEPLLRTSLINTNAGVHLLPLAGCVLSRRTTLKQRAPWTREANFRRCGAMSPCSLERLRFGRPRFDPLVLNTARKLRTSGTGETVHLHFGG